MDLRGQDLSYMDLSGADLTKADLVGVDLTGANLSVANLEYVNLSGANLSGANLEYTNLEYVKLNFANLTDANLTDANLEHANLTGAYLTKANLYAAKLVNANLAGARLTDASLVYASLANADLTGAHLTKANLTDAGLVNANLAGANLANADLTGAYLTKANLVNASLNGASLANADLENANLTSVDLTDADLAGADLNGANLTNADLTGVDLSKAKNVPRVGALREHFKIEAPTSDAFRRWFGASVVVGDDKKPIVVYHGTSEGGFTEFKPEERDAHHNAFYATDDIAVAETYVDRSEPSQRLDPSLDSTSTYGIYRLYIRLLNPMIIEGDGKHWNKLYDPRAPHLGRTFELAKWAQEHGHDGVIFKDILDDGGRGRRPAGKATVYAVFDPKAIKSATANNGNYDPDDPDIRHNPRRSSSRAPRRR
jgi:uncharacterized protein YjbI with pentapeptide repeats